MCRASFVVLASVCCEICFELFPIDGFVTGVFLSSRSQHAGVPRTEMPMASSVLGTTDLTEYVVGFTKRKRKATRIYYNQLLRVSSEEMRI